MRRTALFLSLLILLPTLSIAQKARHKEDTCATCYGNTPCRACTTCGYCKHCAREGGTCGVCKPKPAPKPKPGHKKSKKKHS